MTVLVFSTYATRMRVLRAKSDDTTPGGISHTKRVMISFGRATSLLARSVPTAHTLNKAHV